MTDEQTPTPPPSPEGEAPAGAADDLRVQLEEARKAAEQYKDQLLRKAADFENYRRRANADAGAVIRNANERLLRTLLPVLDDIERFLRQGKTTGESDPFYQGAVLIAQKLEKILLSEGLEPFDASGKPFDVEFHDALQQVPRTDVPPQTVLEVVERGYTLHGRVIRHAKVLVSSAPPPDRPEESAPNADTAPRTDVH